MGITPKVGKVFRGISSISLDAKGRAAIPTRYREELDKELIVTVDTGYTCLLLYPLLEWERIEKKLQELPTFNKAARRIQRLLIGHATDLEIDDSGRILLPKVLRDYAKLEKSAVLVGQGAKLELWDEQLWQNHREQWLNEGDGGGDGGEGLPEEILSLSL